MSEFTIGQEEVLDNGTQIVRFDAEIFDSFDEACVWAEDRSAQERCAYVVTAIAGSDDLARYVSGVRIEKRRMRPSRDQ